MMQAETRGCCGCLTLLQLRLYFDSTRAVCASHARPWPEKSALQGDRGCGVDPAPVLRLNGPVPAASGVLQGGRLTRRMLCIGSRMVIVTISLNFAIDRLIKRRFDKTGLFCIFFRD